MGLSDIKVQHFDVILLSLPCSVPLVCYFHQRSNISSGLLSFADLCRSGAHTKLGVNMVNFGEPSSTRLHKEERTGSGWKHSRLKLPRQTVVG